MDAMGQGFRVDRTLSSRQLAALVLLFAQYVNSTPTLRGGDVQVRLLASEELDTKQVGALVASCAGIVTSLGGLVFVTYNRKHAVFDDNVLFLNLFSGLMVVLNTSSLLSALGDQSACGISYGLFFVSIVPLFVLLFSQTHKAARKYKFEQGMTTRRPPNTHRILMNPVIVSVAAILAFFGIQAAAAPEEPNPSGSCLNAYAASEDPYVLVVYSVAFVFALGTAVKTNQGMLKTVTLASEGFGMFVSTLIFIVVLGFRFACYFKTSFDETGVLASALLIFVATLIATGLVVYRKSFWLSMSTRETKESIWGANNPAAGMTKKLPRRVSSSTRTERSSWAPTDPNQYIVEVNKKYGGLRNMSSRGLSPRGDISKSKRLLQIAFETKDENFVQLSDPPQVLKQRAEAEERAKIASQVETTLRDPEDRKLVRQATVRVQAAYRGKKQRKNIASALPQLTTTMKDITKKLHLSQKERQEEKTTTTAVPKSSDDHMRLFLGLPQETIDEQPTDEDRDEAATTIQRNYRGHRCRISIASRIADKFIQMEEAAARKIQTFYRKKAPSPPQQQQQLQAPQAPTVQTPPKQQQQPKTVHKVLPDRSSHFLTPPSLKLPSVKRIKNPFSKSPRSPKTP